MKVKIKTKKERIEDKEKRKQQKWGHREGGRKEERRREGTEGEGIERDWFSLKEMFPFLKCFLHSKPLKITHDPKEVPDHTALDKERKPIGSFPDCLDRCVAAPHFQSHAPLNSQHQHLWRSQLWPSFFSLSPPCLPPDSSSIPSPSRSFTCYWSPYFPLFIIIQISAIYPKPWPDSISWHQTSAVIFLSHIFNQETHGGMPVPAGDCQVGIKTWPEMGRPKPGSRIGSSETSPVSTKQGRKTPDCVSVWVFVSSVPTREALLSDAWKKEEGRRREQAWGGERRSSFQKWSCYTKGSVISTLSCSPDGHQETCESQEPT